MYQRLSLVESLNKTHNGSSFSFTAVSLMSHHKCFQRWPGQDPRVQLLGLPVSTTELYTILQRQVKCWVQITESFRKRCTSSYVMGSLNLKRCSSAEFWEWLISSQISYILLFDSLGPFSIGDRYFIGPKKVIRTLCKAGPLDHCRPLFTHPKIYSIINLYIFHTLVYTKTHLNLFNIRKDSQNQNTRNKSKLDILQHRLTLVNIVLIT